MNKTRVFIICVMLFWGSFLFALCKETIAKSEKKIPLLDGSAYNLKLFDCWGYKSLIVKKDLKEMGMRGAEDIVDKFKSKKYTYIMESWESRDRTSYSYNVAIKRWYFQYPEDPVLWAESGIETNGRTTIWAEKADVGDKTWWLHQFDMFFVKGNVLVRVHVTPMVMDENTRNYTRNIAEAVERKL